MNKLTIIGNATRDGELRTTQSGVSVCTFTVAVNPKFKREGEEDKTDFFKVTAWRKLGESCGKYVKKGMKVCVIGPVSHEEYTDSKGEKRFNMIVTADDVEFLTHADGDNGSSSSEYNQIPEVPQQPEAPSQSFTDVSGFVDDELPF